MSNISSLPPPPPYSINIREEQNIEDKKSSTYKNFLDLNKLIYKNILEFIMSIYRLFSALFNKKTVKIIFFILISSFMIFLFEQIIYFGSQKTPAHANGLIAISIVTIILYIPALVSGIICSEDDVILIIFGGLSMILSLTSLIVMCTNGRYQNLQTVDKIYTISSSLPLATFLVLIIYSILFKKKKN